MIFPWDTNFNFLVLLKISALYLFNQSVLSSRVFDAKLITCRGINVYALAITTGISSTILTAACGFPSTAITSFLIDSFHFKPNATAKGFVTTDMQAPVSRIARIALLLILVYTLIKVYC